MIDGQFVIVIQRLKDLLMNFSQRLNSLRFAFERLYQTEAAHRSRAMPPLHLLLGVPILERLILLGILDGVPSREIKSLLEIDADDFALTSERMRQAVTTFTDACRDPFAYLPDQITNDVHRRLAELHLRRLFFPSVALCLFGEAVPPKCAALTYKQKALVYCILVEQLTRQETSQLLGATNWSICAALHEAEALLTNETRTHLSPVSREEPLYERA